MSGLDPNPASIAQTRQAINRALERFITSPRVQATFQPLGDTGLLDELKRFILGDGKRFRPLLVLAGWRHFGPCAGIGDDVALEVGVVLEIFHTFLLIHDDVIDRGDLRRGEATLRAALRARYAERDDPDALADHVSLVLGDVCFTLALEHLNALAIPADRRCRLMQALLRYARLTGMGQVLDVLHGAAPLGEVSQPQIETCYDLKTGLYTIECPLVLGALLAGAGADVLDAIGRYARALGIAYQLNDDLIGVSWALDSKSGASDFEQGRQTALLALTLQRASRDDAAWLHARFGKGPLGPDDTAHLMGLYHDTGAVAQLQDDIRRGRANATAHAAALIGDRGDAGGLMTLIDTLVPLPHALSNDR